MTILFDEPVSGAPMATAWTVDDMVESKNRLDNMVIALKDSEDTKSVDGWYIDYRDRYLPEIGQEFPSDDTTLALSVDHYLKTDRKGVYYSGDVVFSDETHTHIYTSRLICSMTSSREYASFI
eukprot:UN29561